MKIFYKLADKSEYVLGCNFSFVSNFCAIDVLSHFSNHPAYDYYTTRVTKKVKNKEEAVLDFVKTIMAKNSRGTKLFIGDRVNHGFHEFLTPFLPEKFTCKNSRGTNIECTVEHGEPYINLNTRAKVKETIIHIKNIRRK